MNTSLRGGVALRLLFKRDKAPDRITCWIEIALVALAYHLLAQMGLLLAIPPGFATAIWPPSGLALAVVLLYGWRLLPGVFLGSFTVNVYLAWSGGELGLMSFWVGAALASGATLQVVLARCFILWGRQKTFWTFQRLTQLLGLLFWGGPVACLVAATIGTYTLLQAGFITAAQWSVNWLNWWVGDTLGVMIFAPCLLLLAQPRRLVRSLRKWQVAAPLVGLFVLLAVGYANARASAADSLLARLRSQANQTQSYIQETLFDVERALIGSRVLFRGSKIVNEKEFVLAVDSLLAINPLIAELGYAKQVSQQARSEFEKNLGVPIWYWGRQKMKVTQGQKPMYVPVVYAAGDENQADQGFDLWSESYRQRAVLQAIKSESSVASQAFNETKFDERAPIMYLMLSIDSATRQDLVFAVIRVGRELQRLSRGLEALGLLYEVREGESGNVIYESARYQDSKVATALVIQHSVSVGGQVWMTRLKPSPTFIAQYMHTELWSLLTVALTFIGLLGAFIVSAVGSAIFRDQQFSDVERNLLSQRRLSMAVIDHLPVMIMLKRASDLRLLEINRVCEKVMGLKRSEMLGRTALEIFPEAVALEIDAADRFALEQNAPQCNSVQIEKKFREIMLNITRIPIADETGHPEFLLSLVEEQTNLEEMRDAYNVLVENLPTGLLIVGRDGSIKYYNPTAQVLFGLRGTNKTVDDLVPESTRSHHASFMHSFFAKPVARSMAEGRSLQALGRDGRVFPVQIGLAPITWRGEECALTLVTDMSNFTIVHDEN